METWGYHKDADQSQILNLVLHNTTTPPSSPVGGQGYYDPVLKKAYIYNDSWNEIINATSSAYSSVTDGTTTANAAGADTLKFRSSSNILSITVGSNDGTHGDNILYAINQGNISHSAIANLSSDDHVHYALLAGRNTGQTFKGGINAGETLTLMSTNHATKGKILFGTSAYDEVNNRLGIGTNAPSTSIEVAAGGAITSPRFISNVSTGTAPLTVTSTTMVSNLNVDYLRGYSTAQTSSAASLVVVTQNSGKIDLTFLSEVIALSNLSDVSGTTGSGNTVVLSTSPTIVTPTLTTPVIASFASANHNHLNAAGGGTLTSASISDFNTQVRTNRLDQMAVPTAAVSMNGQRLTNIPDVPLAGTDAVNMNYVNNIAAGLDVKASVRVASVANVNIASPGASIDGVALALNDRVLLKNQTTASQNGIYIFNGSAAAMTRSTDADSNAEVNAGMFTFVEEGTSEDQGWILTTNNPITLDTTSLSFSQFSSATQIVAGQGLTRTGNTIDVVGTNNRISVFADNIDISSTYVGQTSITTLGTITTGTWNGTDISVADGGTGASTSAGARANLSSTASPLPQIYETIIGDNSSTVFVVTHGLNKRSVVVQVFNNSSPYDESSPMIQRTSTTTVTITYRTAPTTGQYTVVVMG